MFFLKNDLFSARNALHEAPELLESLSRSAERHQKTIGQVSLGHVENIQQLPKIHELRRHFSMFFVFGCDDHKTGMPPIRNTWYCSSKS